MTQNPKGLTTNCNLCTFAIKDGKTQTGCELGRIDKYKEAGTYVAEAEDLEENEFYVIESWCSFYREEEWALQNSDRIKQAYKENEVRLGYLIIIDDNADGLETTIKSIKSQSVPPSYVLVVNNSDMLYSEVISKTVELLDDSDITYKVVNIVEDEADDFRCVDLAFESVLNGFYSVLKSGHVAKEGMIESLNKAINDDFKKPVYIEGWDEINGVTAQAVAHKHFSGNSGQLLIEKIQNIAELEDIKVVYSWNELLS